MLRQLSLQLSIRAGVVLREDGPHPPGSRQLGVRVVGFAHVAELVAAFVIDTDVEAFLVSPPMAVMTTDHLAALEDLLALDAPVVRTGTLHDSRSCILANRVFRRRPWGTHGSNTANPLLLLGFVRVAGGPGCLLDASLKLSISCDSLCCGRRLRIRECHRVPPHDLVCFRCSRGFCGVLISCCCLFL